MGNNGNQVICTERAHYMCPNMEFGILAHIRAEYSREKVLETVRVLQAAHPFLRSLIAEEPGSGKLYYQLQESLDLPLIEKSDVDSWQADYNELTVSGWDVRREGMLKALLYPAGAEFDVLLIAHHLLCDGRGLLQLADEFALYYCHGSVPQPVSENLIAGLGDLPEKSGLPFISRCVIDDANRRWDKEHHRVSHDEYLDFEKAFLRDNPVQREIITVDGGELERVHGLCRQRGVSVNDYLIAKMMLEEQTEKVVIAEDIRTRVSCYRQGAMGNYSTAFSVVIKRKENDVLALAERVASRVASVRKQPQKEMLVLACYLRMRPELIDAVAISTLGDFPSAAGAFVGRNMFGYGSRNGRCLTNLGRVESDVISEAAFIPPASPANVKTWGILTVNGRMKICSVMQSHA